MLLKNVSIVLGVSGSIAAYKSAELCSLLKKEGANVFVIMTKAACEFVAPETFRALSHNKVLIDTFDIFNDNMVSHIDIIKEAAILVVAPATANTIAKFAIGIADNMLSDVFLASKVPVLIAPAMNTNMWTNQSTLNNVKTLRNRYIHFVGPCEGNLACGTTGNGKMVEPKEILENIIHIINVKKDFKYRVLITAGPTIEDIDPVRYITNKSSGKMGYSIAQAAIERGAEVTVISGPVNFDTNIKANIIRVRSAEDMYTAVISNSSEYDIIIQTAAPADFKPKQYSNHKIKKNNNKELVLSFIENKDIALEVGKYKHKNQILVGFAAESQNFIDNAQNKLIMKNLDLIVLNDITKEGAGFEVDTNIATLITSNEINSLDLMSKYELANVIIDKIIEIKKNQVEE